MTGGDGAASDGRRYPAHPTVGVGVVLFRGDAVLMVRRARPPLLGAWSFPGGGQELGETVDEAGRRELLEETGMTAASLVLAGHVDAVHRDRDGRVLFHYTILDLTGWAADGREPVAAGDVSAARFVRFEALATLGVDAAHRQMVERARAAVGPVSSGGDGSAPSSGDGS